MSLASFLSAIKYILIDHDASDALIKDDLTSRFNDLTDDELTDLLSLKKDRLDIYRRSIFGGRLSMIRKRLPVSFFIINKFLSSHVSGYQTLDLATNYERFSSWKARSTLSYLANFSKFIEFKYPNIASQFPFIIELIDFELLGVKIIRDPFKATQPLAIESYLLSELLDKFFVINSITKFFQSEFNLLNIRRSYFNHTDLNNADLNNAGSFLEQLNDSKANSFNAKGDFYYVGGRCLEGDLQWFNISSRVYNFLLTNSSSKESLENLKPLGQITDYSNIQASSNPNSTISSLFEVILEDNNFEESEEVLKKILSLISDLSNAQIISIK